MIARRWTCENIDGYHGSRTFVEKYNLVRGGGGGGGEYALQVGFGWTRGYCARSHHWIRSCRALAHNSAARHTQAGSEV
jgi:neutral trehalase